MAEIETEDQTFIIKGSVLPYICSKLKDWSSLLTYVFINFVTLYTYILM